MRLIEERYTPVPQKPPLKGLTIYLTSTEVSYIKDLAIVEGDNDAISGSTTVKDLVLQIKKVEL
jgi:hypothetical protein